MAKNKEQEAKPNPREDGLAAFDNAVPAPPEPRDPNDVAEIELLMQENARLKAQAEAAAADVAYARQAADKLHAELQEEREAARRQAIVIADYKPPAVTSGVVLVQKLRETGTGVASLGVARRVLVAAETEGRHPTADEVIDALVAANCPGLTIAKAKMIRSEGRWDKDKRPTRVATQIEDKFSVPEPINA